MANLKPKDRDGNGRFDHKPNHRQLVARAREMLARRETMRAVAKELGVSVGWVHRVSKESARA